MTVDELPDHARSTDAAFPNGLRDVRYGEVFLLRQDPDGFRADVWNTLGLNDCPQAAWDALDPQAIAAEHGALAAILNGPRHWTLDAIISAIRDAAPTIRLGDLDLFLAATIELGADLPVPAPYVERRIARETVFLFRAGRPVHVLVDPTGQEYVLQAYSLAVDPTQTLDSLATLGERITPPAGWSFATRTPDEDLGLRSRGGIATILQDELQNTYQRHDR